MEQLTREAVIAAARHAANDGAAETLSRKDFVRLTGISQHQIYKLFPEGGWLEVVRLAGLKHDPQFHGPLSDDELLAEFHAVASSVGDVPTWAVFGARARVSADVIRKRFGGLQGTLKRYRVWLEENDPSSPLLAVLDTKSRHELPSPPAQGVLIRPPDSARWAKLGGTEYGGPISFRGLRHAPLNEQGVVYLFGMVSYELGFLVEAIHSSFPDCEAKRCIDRRADRWERVRIEFEYRSRNFLEHGHPPSDCDIVVCWEHDWADCPLEVVELRRVLDDLQG